MTTSASRLDVSSCGKFDLGMPFPTLPLSLSVGPVPLHASAECVSGILESLRLARTALTELAESLATNARLASTAAESYSVAEPPLFTSMGGFSHVAIDALSLVANFWPHARPTLQQILL